MTIKEKIKQRLQDANVRYWANDNIADYLEEGEKQQLLEEAVPAFENMLQHLLIDTETDPNSQDTARRMAKMYINEIMSGRYEKMPNPSAFPNYIEGGYEGMLVVRSELTSLCSHHHQTVKGVAYIGIIAGPKLLGLSKYTRIAQWCARRGTLQEELNVMIADAIQRETGSDNIGVYVQATHGCCENRGIMATSSLTQTTVLRGAFKKDADVRKEFIDNVKLQQDNSRYTCS
jgi:GTP cyclohydrolase I